jgi:hypothetical protein
VLHPPGQLGRGIALLPHRGPVPEDVRGRAGQVTSPRHVGQSAAERGRGEDGGAAQPSGVVEQEQLHERAAHRHADDVRPVDAEPVEQADDVGGEVPDRVRRDRVRPGGAAGVAVVVPDHPVPLRQPVDQRLGPGEATGVGPHHEQQRRSGRVAALLGPEVDTRRHGDAVFHGGSLARARPASTAFPGPAPMLVA